MANRRMISSSTWEDEFIGELDFFQRCLWIGLFSSCADDQGRLLDNPILIRAKLFPYDDIQIEKIEEGLVKFQEHGKILRYSANGKALIQILRWWENQKSQWAGRSKYTAPDGWTDHIRTRENGKYISENWDSRDEIDDPSPEDFTRTLQAGRQYPVPVPVNVPVPDPIPIPVPVVNASATASFFSKFQSIAGPLMGNKQVDQIKDLLLENGDEKILEIARWLVEDKGETSMNKIIAAIRTAAPEWKSGNNNESVFEEWLKNGNKTNSNAADAAIEQTSPAVQTNA